MFASIVAGLLAAAAAPTPTSAPAAAPVTVQVEVVREPETLRRGLQGHAPLGARAGMLFVLPGEETARFWMKDMTYPIDIVFVAGDGAVVNIAARVPPCAEEPCAVYASDAPVTHVLELAAGESARLGIAPGRRLDLDPARGRVTLPTAPQP